MRQSSSQSPSVSFLHTSPLHVETFERLLSARLPDIERNHLVQESLLEEARENGMTSALEERVATCLLELADSSPALVICTCSTLGAVAEMQTIGVPIMRIDRPMAEAAIRLATAGNGRIGLAATLESSVESTRALLIECAHRTGSSIASIDVVPCFDAWEDFERGDTDAYAQSIAASVQSVADQYAVIVLAQASMSGARAFLCGTATPVLSSPDLLVDALARYIDAFAGVQSAR